MTDHEVSWSSADGRRHHQVLRCGPVPEEFAAVFRRRGIEVPLASTPIDPAALVPYGYRSFHEAHARASGYFWHPCVLCGLPFGGHEISEVIPDPCRPPNGGVTICPACSAARNHGEV